VNQQAPARQSPKLATRLTPLLLCSFVCLSISQWRALPVRILSYYPHLVLESIICQGSGFQPHLPGFKHKFLAKALGATMWFFIFYRARFVYLLFMIFSKMKSRFQRGRPQTFGTLTFDCQDRTNTNPVVQGIKHPWEGHGHEHHEEVASHR
jgi:hypothetical protein